MEISCVGISISTNIPVFSCIHISSHRIRYKVIRFFLLNHLPLYLFFLYHFLMAAIPQLTGIDIFSPYADQATYFLLENNQQNILIFDYLLYLNLSHSPHKHNKFHICGFASEFLKISNIPSCRFLCFHIYKIHRIPNDNFRNASTHNSSISILCITYILPKFCHIYIVYY